LRAEALQVTSAKAALAAAAGRAGTDKIEIYESNDSSERCFSLLSYAFKVLSASIRLLSALIRVQLQS
jgi:hypothetical protein